MTNYEPVLDYMDIKLKNMVIINIIIAIQSSAIEITNCSLFFQISKYF